MKLFDFFSTIRLADYPKMMENEQFWDKSASKRLYFPNKICNLDRLDRLERKQDMNGTWQIQDAKNKLSEVIAQAIKQGPQLITRRGKKAAVVMSYAEYEKLCNSQGKFSEFFRTSPLAGIDLARDKSLPRDKARL